MPHGGCSAISGHDFETAECPFPFLYYAGTLDDSRLAPIDIVWTNLWFINVFDQGEARTEQERRQWLAEAGLESGERVTYPDGRSIMVARKPP